MDNQELEQYIEEYGTDLYSFCMHLTKNVQEADDLYQDTFLTLVDKKKKIENGRNPKSYLLSVAIRIWKNKKRKFAWRQRIAPSQNYEEYLVHLLTESEPSPEEIVLSREKILKVWSAVDQLSEKYRIPVYLYYLEELSVGEIASILNLPRTTIKNRLYTARKTLKNNLKLEEMS